MFVAPGSTPFGYRLTRGAAQRMIAQGGGGKIMHLTGAGARELRVWEK